jgi:hypothetical protein
MEMAELWFENALIARGKALKARITMPLIETLIGVAPAGDAGDRTSVCQGQITSDQRIEIQDLIAYRQLIPNRVLKARYHLFDSALHQ